MKKVNYFSVQVNNQGKPRSHFGFNFLTVLILLTQLFFISKLGIAQLPFKSDTVQTLSWQRTFDKKDRLSKITNPARQAIRYSYTEDSVRITSMNKKYDNGDSVQYEFDKSGLLNLMKDQSGKVKYCYDDFNRINQIQRDGEPPLQYAYDLENRITKLKIGNYKIEYAYDFMGRVSEIITPAGLIKYSYQSGQGLVIRTLPNGIRTEWEFDVNGQQKKLTHVDNKDYVLLEFTYQYRPDGLIEYILEKSPKRETLKHFEYDKVGRLTQVTDQLGKKYVYSYDQLGNRLSASIPDETKISGEYDWAGRLIKFNGNDCTHDNSGNLTSLLIDDYKMQYQYNLDGQLASVDHALWYKYDGDGLLIERNNDGKKTKFVNNPLADFWQPLVLENETEGKTEILWDKNSPLIVFKNGQPEYVLTDHLGSARLILDKNGTILENLEYDPFGSFVQKKEGYGLIPGFSGLFYDLDAQLYLTAARTYNPTLGQFMQVEPIKQIPSGSQKELTLYAYCGNDPVNFVDLNGSWPQFIWGPENWAWQALHLNWLNRDYAKEYYANRELNTQSKAMSWLWGTIGGYIPGKEKSIRQKYISDIWDFVPVISTARTWSSSLLNAKEGKFMESFYDILDLGVSYIGDSKNIDRIGKNFIKNNLDKYITNQTLKETNSALVHGKKYIDDLSNIELFNKASNKLLDYQGDLLKIDDYSCSNVGGVYLGGAGQNLEGMGQIEGLSLDKNNNLILIGKKGNQLNLPPMRLNDLVTVFRSVYIHGTGPTVTIDPNPAAPDKSAMIIKHDEGTKETYVGWVLYQCDRLMKCYMLGYDNNTAKEFKSNVSGYQQILDSIYFGGFTNSSDFEGKWERFWIVPSKINQYKAKDNELTLFDVPLKLKTQLMKWENGLLVDDSLGESSPGARCYTKWFTENYEKIADEQFLLPPTETGITKPVAVFRELKRIALITAIAEQMRDQKVPMPFWMRNHEVEKIDFEKFTPGMEITRKDGNLTSRIFGGVTLIPEKNDVKQYTTIPDLKQATVEEQNKVTKGLSLSNSISHVISDFAEFSKPLETKSFEIEKVPYQTFELPGSETLALAPNELKEMDMVVPVTENKVISLARNFNSFFNPKDCWGTSWTMNLPQLVNIKIPEENSNGDRFFRNGYEFITPLNSLYVRFSEIKEVPSLKTSLVVPDEPCDFFGIAIYKPEFLQDTTISLFGKNDETWYFTKTGYLVAYETQGFRTLYQRNQNGNVSQIVGTIGENTLATIDLKYNESNKLISATGKNYFGYDQTITYYYDENAKLSTVETIDGILNYKYNNTMVSDITWKNINAVSTTTDSLNINTQHFEYNKNGQVLTEQNGNIAPLEYVIHTDKEKCSLATRLKGDSLSNSVTFDAKFRPVEAKYENGYKAKWNYMDNGDNIVELTNIDGEISKITQFADKTKVTYNIANQPQIDENYSVEGKLDSVKLNNQKLFSLEWTEYGSLKALNTKEYNLSPEYDKYGVLKSIHQTDPNSNYWQETQYDIFERPSQVTDYSGLKTNILYDNSGGISKYITERDGRNCGYSFSRNKDGRVDSIVSSWNKKEYQYDSLGLLKNIKVLVPASKDVLLTSSFDFESGLLSKITQFDGGQIGLTYHKDIDLFELPDSIICQNGLKLVYAYSNDGIISGVSVGNERKINLDYDSKGRVIGYSFSNR